MNKIGKFLIIVLLFAAFLNNGEVFAQQSWGINCGGSMDYTSPAGVFFKADQSYSVANGYGLVNVNSWASPLSRMVFAHEGLDTLYFFQREGEFTYRFDATPDTYAVNLFLCEKQNHWYNVRNFSVYVEDELRLDSLDLFALGNHDYCITYRLLAVCTDGQLDIDLIPNIGNATLGAVSVRQITEDSTPPEVIQDFNIIPGYNMNILYWMWNAEPDFQGYRVYKRELGGVWEAVTDVNYPLTRYIDKDVAVGTEYEYAVSAVDLWGNESDLTDSLSAVPVVISESPLPIYNFEMTEANLFSLYTNIWSDEYLDANLTLEGFYYPGSGVRLRGSNMREFPKKSYKMQLPSGMTHNGMDRMCFNGQFQSTMISERMSYLTFEMLDCISSETRNIHLDRNGEYIGFYLECEPVDNDFLERRGLSPAGNLYKAEYDLTVMGSYNAYVLNYPKINNDGSDWYDIIDFIEWLNGATTLQFHNEAGGKIALDDFLDVYTVLIATSDADFVAHNFYMYYNPVNELWYSLPWDHNESFDIPDLPIDLGKQGSAPNIGYNALIDRILNDNIFLYSYCKRLQRFIDSDFNLTDLTEIATGVHTEIYDDAMRDINKFGFERPDYFLNSLDSLIAHLELRIPFMETELARMLNDPILYQEFRLNEIQAVNNSTIMDEAGDYDPWIEIYNLSPVRLDLEDFVLSLGTQNWTLPAEAVVDGYGYLMIWLDGEPNEGPLHSTINLTATTGTLTLQGRHGGTSDNVTFTALNPDQVWARGVDGIGDWTGDLAPTPNSTNAPPADPSPLVINEFLAVNTSIIPDSAGDYDDWLELYNPADYAIPLTGLFMTDDFTRPTKWSIPHYVLEPHQFLLIWCDDEAWEGGFHSTFKLSGGGEQLGLYDRDGETLIDGISFGAQSEDVSFGRYPDGLNTWMPLYTPTPAGPNNPVTVLKSGGEGIPDKFALDQNYPNPFNPSTFIKYDLPYQSRVKLEIFNILGQKVYTLLNGIEPAGYKKLVWNADYISSGIYIYRIEASAVDGSDKFTSLKKMVMVK